MGVDGDSGLLVSSPGTIGTKIMILLQDGERPLAPSHSPKEGKLREGFQEEGY